MKIHLSRPIPWRDADAPSTLLALIGLLVVLGALASLPGPTLFLAGLAGSIALAVPLAALRRDSPAGLRR